MAGYDVVRAMGGWQLDLDGLVLHAAAARLDRGVVRTAVTVRQEGAIVYRNTVNLTSAQSRGKLIEGLQALNLTIDERALIALEDACRSGSKVVALRAYRSGPTAAPGAPLTLEELQGAFGRWLLIADQDFLPVLVGALLAHRLGGEAVWLLIVAPPGGTKSEPLRSLYEYPGIFPLSDLTARTFASGLDTDGDASLLARLSDETLVLKDLTTVLEMQHDERQAVFAQLREIYDGRFDKVWGTGRELHWQGRLGFLAGVTPIIDRHQAALSVLGERFVLFRLVMPDRLALATRALESAGQEEAMREELSTAMHQFLAGKGSQVPAVSSEAVHTLAAVADFVTRARSGVVRDGHRRELEYAPEPEAPTRFAKVLLSLGRGIAVADDAEEVGERELRLVMRVALDCLPVIRQRVIAALVSRAITDGGDGMLSTTQIAGAAQFSASAIRRALEDLQALGLVSCQKRGAGLADQWELLERWRSVFQLLSVAARCCAAPSHFSETPGGTVPEKEEGAAHETMREIAPERVTAELWQEVIG